MSEPRERTREWTLIPSLLLGLVVVFGGLYVAVVLYTGQRVAEGTSVNGIDVGGLRPAAAERKLQEGLDGRAAEPITVSANGQRAVLRPETAGLTVAVRSTVRQTQVRRSWRARDVWDYFAGRHELSAIVSVDESRLDRAVSRFADQVDQPAVDGAVRFTAGGEVSPRYPSKGRVLDRRRAAAVLRAAFLQRPSSQVVRLPTEVAEPAVAKEAVSRAMDGFANPAMSGAVVIRLAGQGVRIDPEDFAPALSMQADHGELRPRLDARVLVRLLRPRMRQVDRAPRDARFAVSGDRARVVPGRAGVTFRASDVTDRFLDLVTHDPDDRTLTARSVRARPAFSTADARALKITRRVSAFSTRFPYAAYRNVNLGRAAALVDGTVLEPGHTFSLNRTIGERTPANGFTEGYVIADGVFKLELGGGVSQVATTTFNAAFFAGMADVEHKAHSFYIDRYPVGREATVVWPDIDLKFKDTTPYGVLVRASITKATPSRPGTMRVSMYSTRYWDISTSTSARYAPTPPSTRRLSGPGCVPNTGYAGFDIDVQRVFRRHGSADVDHRETVHTTYTPSDTVLCR